MLGIRSLRELALALIAAVALTLVVAPDSDAAKKRGKRITVMTRNIYLGGDISRPLLAQNPNQFVRFNTELWETVQKTDFPSRAPLLAREIRSTKPHVIGLQEVALWRRGADGVVDGPATPATTVVYDFLQLLLDSLKAQGLNYRAVSVQDEADVEAPIEDGYDVRLTMRDVILVRKMRRLRVRRERSENFDARLTIPTAGGSFTALRGWNAIDATYKRKRFRFVNTHLEAFLDGIRLQQAQELAADNGPLDKRGTVILVGDINSDPNDAGGADPASYNVFTSAGFFDTWILRNGTSRPGYTCCMKREDITDPPPAPFDHRIDHIFVKPKRKVVRTRIVGRNPNNRTATGLWPSDHGGAAHTLILK